MLVIVNIVSAFNSIAIQFQTALQQLPVSYHLIKSTQDLSGLIKIPSFLTMRSFYVVEVMFQVLFLLIQSSKKVPNAMHKINWIRLNSLIVPHLHTLENLKINENKWKWPEMRVLRSWKLWMVAFENKRKESIKRMYQQITFYAMLFEMQQPANVRPKLCN